MKRSGAVIPARPQACPERLRFHRGEPVDGRLCINLLHPRQAGAPGSFLIHWLDFFAARWILADSSAGAGFRLLQMDSFRAGKSHSGSTHSGDCLAGESFLGTHRACPDGKAQDYALSSQLTNAYINGDWRAALLGPEKRRFIARGPQPGPAARNTGPQGNSISPAGCFTPPPDLAVSRGRGLADGHTRAAVFLTRGAASISVKRRSISLFRVCTHTQ
jgi:hypothetical protein